MDKLRVHVGLKPDVLAEIQSGSAAEVKKATKVLTEKLGLEKPNVKRFQGLGVLSGDTSSEKVEELKQADEVAWVELDTKRHIF
jgi:hypothetical protein